MGPLARVGSGCACLLACALVSLAHADADAVVSLLLCYLLPLLLLLAAGIRARGCVGTSDGADGWTDHDSLITHAPAQRLPVSQSIMIGQVNQSVNPSVGRSQ